MAMDDPFLLAQLLIQWGDVVGRFWPVAVVSLAVSLAATPICRGIALKCGIVDRPDEFLKPGPWRGGVGLGLTPGGW